jgi:hypothetical protein
LRSCGPIEEDDVDLGNGLRAAAAEWEAATAGGADACGLGVAAAAYQRMQRAWAAELAAQADLLSLLDALPDGLSAATEVARDGQ